MPLQKKSFPFSSQKVGMWKLRFISTALMSQNWSMQSFKSKPGVNIVVVAGAFVVVIAIVDPKEKRKTICVLILTNSHYY